ncbi:MAG: hypothetical protein E7080_08865 [Bacteroidales bacterium]|nr:hypothetical protein [Bacteroidales bacterium]
MNFMKRAVASAMAVLCLSFAANADNKLYFKDFSVVPGTEKTVQIYMDHEGDVASLEAAIVLPEGLSFKTVEFGGSLVYYVLWVDGVTPTHPVTSEKAHSLSVNPYANNSNVLLMLTIPSLNFGEIQNFSHTSGSTVINCTLVVSDSFSGGEIKLCGYDSQANVIGSPYSIVMTDAAGTKYDCVAETTATVSLEKETGVEDILAEGAEAEFYTLQGVKVAKADLTQGVYVKKVGNKAAKVVVK